MNKESEVKNTQPPIKGFKGFDRDMKCRGFQFEEGKTYKHDDDVEVCNSGFHFCENPLDVFGYYPPGQSVFREVEGSGESSRHSGDSKVAVSEIKIGVELSLHNFIASGIKFLFERKYTESGSNHLTGDRSAASVTGYQSAASVTGNRSAASVTGDQSAASVTGYQSAASVTGNRSAASVTGYRSAASVTGNRSAASVTGDRSAASVTGDQSAASVTGDLSAASVTGDLSAASVTGNWSAASVTGDLSAASVTGNCSAAVCTGNNSKAMCGPFGIIALQWWNGKEERREMRCAEIGCGDGSDGKLKANVWYSLDESGRFLEF